jgi:hypothetical protein
MLAARTRTLAAAATSGGRRAMVVRASAAAPAGAINPSIRKGEEKVVDVLPCAAAGGKVRARACTPRRRGSAAARPSWQPRRAARQPRSFALQPARWAPANHRRPRTAAAGRHLPVLAQRQVPAVRRISHSAQ